MASIRDTYAFLLDENVSLLLNVFPRARCKRVDDYGASGADDEKIVELAGDEGLIIVTNNTRDYTRAMRRVAQKGDRRRHLCGLLTLGADTVESQRRLLVLDKIEKKISLNDRPVDWQLVTFGNLRVHVRRARDIIVSRLLPCPCRSKNDRDTLDRLLGTVSEA